MNSILSILGTLGPILSLIGTYCLILSYTKKYEIEHTIKKGKVAEGKVIEMREDPDHSPSDISYRGVAPVVEFRTDNGLFQHISTTYRKSSTYEVGKMVTIYYYHYKSRREMALVDDEPGTLPGTLLKWGIILCVIGYPILISKLGGLF
ncbi:MAG: hypothetical protein HOP11_00275 [Saprospiraceae bacterium]|nr:hypothetical protein [Saprospiraceae bacterium]